MQVNWKKWKKLFFNSSLPIVVIVIKACMTLLLRTCRVEIKGLEQFSACAKKKKCMLMFWHNRLTIIPFILSKYTPDLLFAGLVSSHGDGKILSTLIHSFPNGRTIECSQREGHNAIREIIRRLNEERLIVIITPDGPRGPLHKVKSGIAVAAMKTEANVFTLNWEADRFWELNTWDKQRIPKPFSKIHMTIGNPIYFSQSSAETLEEAKERLKEALLANN